MAVVVGVALLCACGGLHPTTVPARATIAGTIRAPGGAANEAANRVVEAVEVNTGHVYRGRTNKVGDYALLVPAGDYRLAVTLRATEEAANKVEPVHVEPGGIQAGVDFEIAVAP